MLIFLTWVSLDVLLMNVLIPLVKVEIKVVCICEEFKCVKEFEFDLEHDESFLNLKDVFFGYFQELVST